MMTLENLVTGRNTAERLECTIINDNTGKTLSINDGKKQFTIPFEAVERYLR